MITYTCPHCGQHNLSTQRRHNCPKPPSLSIPLGPPRSMDPCANEYIARLTRELEEARALLRELTGRDPVLDDARLRYVEIQVDRQTWDEVCALAARQQVGSE